MRLPRYAKLQAGIVCWFLCAVVANASGYKDFRVAVYARAYEVQQMKDPAWLESRWTTITNGLKVDKIYLETHRDGVIPDQQTLDAVKQFFKSKGVATAAGIATVVNERNRFETFVYIGLFAYDNGKFIVENFAAPGGNTVAARAVVDKKFTKLVDVVSGQTINGQARGDKMVFELTLAPASYRVLSAE